MDNGVQVVVEVSQFKLSKQAWLGNISRKVIFHATGHYRKHVVQSSDYVLKSGAQLALPWSSKLDKIVFHYHYIDDRIKVELGETIFTIPTDKSFLSDGSENRVSLPILPCGGDGVHRIGKVLAIVYVQELYDDSKSGQRDVKPRVGNINPSDRKVTALVERPPPGFRFRRMNKAVNWQRVRMASIDRYSILYICSSFLYFLRIFTRIVETNNIHSVMACLDDVAYGDVDEEGLCRFDNACAAEL